MPPGLLQALLHDLGEVFAPERWAHKAALRSGILDGVI
jgi:hypothetical protein